jgi:ankyrin repeat protein
MEYFFTEINLLIWKDDVKSLHIVLNKITNKEIEGVDSLNHWDHRGNPPLHLAIMLKRSEIVKLLLGILIQLKKNLEPVL